jgi:Putative Flp pilus-assembly TadE/G-like
MANLLDLPERGGATLVGLALAGFVLMAGVVAVDVGALAGARAAVQTAADMAALAALTPEGEPASPRADWGHGSGAFRFQAADQEDGRASWAAEIAMANGAELVRCDCSAVQAVVSVRRRVRFVPGGLTVSVTARARAVLGRPPP